jgi:hypothetical protein
MVYLREIFMAELIESMTDGLVPLLLRVVAPVYLAFSYHRHPTFFNAAFSWRNLLAAFGLLVLSTGSKSDDGAISMASGSSVVRISPSINSDPLQQGRSGWRGWDSIMEMPWWKEDTFAPAARQLLFVLTVLTCSNMLARFLGSTVLELACGIRTRVTQCRCVFFSLFFPPCSYLLFLPLCSHSQTTCFAFSSLSLSLSLSTTFLFISLRSGNFGGESVLYLGMILRSVSVLIVAVMIHIGPIRYCARNWIQMLIPEEKLILSESGAVRFFLLLSKQFFFVDLAW